MKQKAKDLCEHLIFMAKNRESYYDNSFPGNCCQIHDRGVISADCIGLVKGIINDPDIWKRFKPSGYYVRPGQIIGDWSEEGILQHCTSVSPYFPNIRPGEYLYMAGHAGIFCGEFEHGGGICNTVECTTDFGDNGITSSYLDPASGRRYDHKGGTEWRSWERHGKLSDYIEYDNSFVDVIYQVFDDVKRTWLEAVEGTSDYAGIYGHDVDCVSAAFYEADLYYKVHTWKGDESEKYNNSEWLPEVKNRNDYAGIKGRPIDGFMIRCDSSKYKISYRVHLRKKDLWLDWVEGCNEKDPENGFAGIIGEPIDALQMKIIKIK